MERERLTYLYQQYLQGKASSEELDEWQKIIHDPSLKEALGNIIDNSYYQILEKDIQNLEANRSEEIYHDIISHTADERNLSRSLWPKILIAAAVATMIASAGIWFFNNNKEAATDQVAKVNDIAPGKQGATLTLASGKKIKLTEVANGELAKEAGVVITKSANGQLVYDIKGSKTESNKQNTLSTANGETYQVRLPDGSLVWLNAASSLTYSASLIESGLRRVKLDGEGYFEISKDKQHPFIVESHGQEVEVLGTHFNVNSYEDESAIKTTLLEGSVKINVSGLRPSLPQGKSRILKPNEQSQVTSEGKISVTEVVASEAIAWKNGKFIFNEETIESVMRKLSRWYNVEVVYEGDFSNIRFDGSISRSDKISKILDKITFTQAVKFKIDGRRIYVTK